VFYNFSDYDGVGIAADERDDAAVAAGKSALLPSANASFANVTSDNKRINRVMIDVAGLPRGGVLDARDFAVRVGNFAEPTTWKALVDPGPRNTLRRGAGGSDRIMLVWENNSVRNTWLQVTVLANADTGLAAPDVFYFGNLLGDTGPASGAPSVDAADWARALAALATPNPTTRAALLDINRDRVVDHRDASLIRQNLHHRLVAFTAPPATSGIPAVTVMVPSSAPTRRRPHARASLEPSPALLA
jgi:hypothetical protein